MSSAVPSSTSAVTVTANLGAFAPTPDQQPPHLHHHQPRSAPRRSLRLPASSASTPNLNSVYLSPTSAAGSANAPVALATRPAPSSPTRKRSLAALAPSALTSIPDGAESVPPLPALSDAVRSMAPATPGRPAGEDVAVGDSVDVPGGMHGVVRFVGQVQGKKGVFAGVELDRDFAVRGKNSGNVDGVSYFTTSTPGAGIFLPLSKALRRISPGTYTVPVTPTTNGLKAGNQNSTNYTPPTPSLPKFSASVGPGVRAPSPQGKRPRTSLPRPDSPVRRPPMTPGPRPSISTPAKVPAPRYAGSPTNRFAQSVRGTSGDPSKRSRLDGRPLAGPRSASALGAAPAGYEESIPASTHRSAAQGSVGPSSMTARPRSASRVNAASDDDPQQLRAQLEDRDRQLKEQAATLAEMESSLTELQVLMESPDFAHLGDDGMGDKSTAKLRQMLREKNEKIAMLTAEFDAHRADFRSTIDTLEMASTETERVYEKRMEELMADIRELESRNLDVDSVASQLKQLEELVQELEEGLEDARRGEAEARGEVEFLRGEVERTRAELQREREKAGSGLLENGDLGFSAKEMEQKDDEIRGLKAIIHSLSRDPVPNAEARAPARRVSSFMGNNEAVENKIARDNLERQVAELQSILDRKTGREEELELEVEALRAGNASKQRNSASVRRSSLRDSRDTVILARSHETRSPEATHGRKKTLDTMPESDNVSSATENSGLWCEICETGGHDILTCTNVFGSESGAMANGEARRNHGLRPAHLLARHDDAHPAPLSPAKPKSPPLATAVKVMPNPMESGPVAGKESGVVDAEKWCAVCERDGHDSVDCPFEDAF